MLDNVWFRRKLESTMTRTRTRRISRLPVLALFALIGAFSCRSGSGTPEVGSESHFLSVCSGDCPNRLSCLCGACTRTCADNGECSTLASGATCVGVESRAPATCPGGTPTFCDMPCTVDTNCASLGAQYRCQSGYCRALNGGATASVCPATSLQLGDNTGTVQVGDTTRTYVVRVPTTYTGAAPVPLVLDFHGLGDSVALEAESSGYRNLAEQDGFIVAWPQGIEGSWNIGPCCTSSRTVDDIGFAKAVVQQIEKDICIDAKRVYAVGYVMGGGMALYLGCNAADVFAGVASSGFDLLAESDAPCQPTRPVTEISFRGTADTVMPYAGGTTTPPSNSIAAVTLTGAIATFQKWAALDQCTGEPTTADSDGCSTYSQCQGGAAVTLCTAQGGGEAWGSATVGWNMLKAHPMP